MSSISDAQYNALKQFVIYFLLGRLNKQLAFSHLRFFFAKRKRKEKKWEDVNPVAGNHVWGGGVVNKCPYKGNKGTRDNLPSGRERKKYLPI